jgi:hypothetical protein
MGDTVLQYGQGCVAIFMKWLILLNEKRLLLILQPKKLFLLLNLTP